ncbi:MAG: hypothetical protein LBM61_00455 [Prevotellaceae bacterium]|nr:hypothetical protein [Prevotellaceae bacterium]
MKRTAAVCLTIGVLAGWYGCTEKHTAYRSYEDYPVPESSFVEMRYAPDTTVFTLWAPTATEVAVRLYEAAEGGYAYRYISLLPKKNGIWSGVSTEDLEGKFYTFEVRTDRWLGETPGINARVVGVNGQRGAIIHPRTTDPPGWEADKRPVAIRPEEMVIYELHLRDFSMDSVSGMNQKGKYLALTERYRTLDRAGSILSTGLDHLLELGVTHINLLPVFDFSAVDENYIGNDDYIQHSWGYEPLNHNALEGSYSTQPTVPAMRIREFKQ